MKVLKFIYGKFRKKPSFNIPPSPINFPIEFDDNDKSICADIISNHLSMVSKERLFATLMACHYVCESNIEGDFVECGVWRGGNSLIAADVFRRHSNTKKVYLFDTFAGMKQPTEKDIQICDNTLANITFQKEQKTTHNDWCYASLEDAINNFKTRGLLNDKIKFIQGDVKDTLREKSNLPEKISVLRLDTDWYESTLQELETLWPLLHPRGILIVDDFGHWRGAKQAVDEFFSKKNRPFAHYIDYTGRLFVKD